ncbi:MAG: hypothetical protein JXL20_01965 [Deltaproteobacteria bacterium]|nr:hypothetical protein [Deltaproteobacteria bacterium]
MSKERQAGFRIGTVHGRLSAQKQDSEAQLRNELYLIGMLKIEMTQQTSTDIRLVAYEMPLEAGQPRGSCIDLFGYDQDHNPWLIELKASDSNENMADIVEQINRYARSFESIKAAVQAEVCARYHWNGFHFGKETHHMILAGREFWVRRSGTIQWPEKIYCCSFARIQSECNEERVVLLEKNTSGWVGLKIENRAQLVL